MGTLIGVNVFREAIVIATIVTDNDGGLKIKRIEEFIDSKGHLEAMRALEAAKPKK